MARHSIKVIDILRKTAARIASAHDYQWGHMGSCNCGFLAQEISHLRKDEIHKRAMERYGDWNEQLNDYCPTSGLLMDDLISDMLTFGFDVDDLKHLEKLSDHRVVHQLQPDQRSLKHNVKGDVVRYMYAWADMIEQQLLTGITFNLEAPLRYGGNKYLSIPS